jgi:hypothetical protein
VSVRHAVGALQQQRQRHHRRCTRQTVHQPIPATARIRHARSCPDPSW